MALQNYFLICICICSKILDLSAKSFFSRVSSDPLIFALTLRIDRKLSIAVAVSEHARGIELPQGALSALLRRAREDLVVVGEAQQTHYFRERQVGAATAHRGESHTRAKDELKRRPLLSVLDLLTSPEIAHTQIRHTQLMPRRKTMGFKFAG